LKSFKKRLHWVYLMGGGKRVAKLSGVLVGAQMPAVFGRTGYITHYKEGRHLVDRYYQELLAEGIARGIKRYLDTNK